MRRVTVAACAALCLMGISSLALAEEGTKYGDQMKTGKLSEEPSVLGNKREPVRADDATKREPVPDSAMKSEKIPQRTYSGEGARYGDQREPGAKSGEGAKYGDQREPGKSSGQGAKYGDQMETGKLSQEPSVLGIKREPVRADDAMKSTEKEHKEKMTTHKDAAKAALSAPAPATKP